MPQQHSSHPAPAPLVKMQKMRRAAIMGAVLCASGAQANWAERLWVLEVVASTRSGGGAATATTCDAAGDVSPQLSGGRGPKPISRSLRSAMEPT